MNTLRYRVSCKLQKHTLMQKDPSLTYFRIQLFRLFHLTQGSIISPKKYVPTLANRPQLRPFGGPT